MIYDNECDEVDLDESKNPFIRYMKNPDPEWQQVLIWGILIPCLMAVLILVLMA